MTSPHTPTIGAIHATPLSIAPLAAAMAADFPAARLRNVLDDSLLDDLRAAGGLTSALESRMERLVEHVLADGIDALQFACSGYAAVVDRAASRLPIPVRKPDEAMYRGLAEGGRSHLAVVATIEPALDLAVAQIERLLADHGASAQVTARCVPDAMEAAQRGDLEELEAALVHAVGGLPADVEVVAFAQYSMGPAAGAVTRATGREVVTGPGAAARDLRQALGGESGRP